MSSHSSPIESIDKWIGHVQTFSEIFLQFGIEKVMPTPIQMQKKVTKKYEMLLLRSIPAMDSLTMALTSRNI